MTIDRRKSHGDSQIHLKDNDKNDKLFYSGSDRDVELTATSNKHEKATDMADNADDTSSDGSEKNSENSDVNNMESESTSEAEFDDSSIEKKPRLRKTKKDLPFLENESFETWNDGNQLPSAELLPESYSKDKEDQNKAFQFLEIDEDITTTINLIQITHLLQSTDTCNLCQPKGNQRKLSLLRISEKRFIKNMPSPSGDVSEEMHFAVYELTSEKINNPTKLFSTYMLHEEDIEGAAIPNLYAKYPTIEGMKKFAAA
jgi:hypothetical protein